MRLSDFSDLDGLHVLDTGRGRQRVRVYVVPLGSRGGDNRSPQRYVVSVRHLWSETWRRRTVDTVRAAMREAERLARVVRGEP